MNVPNELIELTAKAAEQGRAGADNSATLAEFRKLATEAGYPASGVDAVVDHFAGIEPR